MEDLRTAVVGLYAIVDPNLCGRWNPIDFAMMCVRGGARVLQWRQKGVTTGERLPFCRRLSELKRQYDFCLIVNDDPVAALESGADGVHLGQNDRSVTEARKILGSPRLIGRSTHSLDEVKRALNEEIDYLALGAIFPTKTKPPDHPVVGLGLLREVILSSQKPVVAIGGINRLNAEGVIETGVAAMAVISALTQAKNPEEEVRFYSGLFFHEKNPSHRRS